MRAWLSIAGLLLVVAALGVWVYLAPAPEKVETVALSQLRPDDVQRISFTRVEPPPAGAQPDAKLGTVILERAHGTWRVTAPFSARAEPFQVERLLGILDARASARLPARELAQYGLEAPSARLTLDEQAFSFGGVNPLTREQYVLTNDAVYAIPLAQRTTLPRDLDALVARALFAREEHPVRFSLPGFSMTLEEGRWRLEPDPNETTADERNAWVDGWRSATAIRATRARSRSVSSKIAIALKDGTKLAIGIVQREPELVLVRPDEGIEYAFLPEIGKRLLEPPARKE
jgi:hypothetical protein